MLSEPEFYRLRRPLPDENCSSHCHPHSDSVEFPGLSESPCPKLPLYWVSSAGYFCFEDLVIMNNALGLSLGPARGGL